MPPEPMLPEAGRTAPAVTIDELFRRTLARSPASLALADPPNKLNICGQAPMRLSYAQADRAMAAIAARFQTEGLAPGSIIAMQLPNTIEAPLTLLAALRAGITVALIPQLWREAELTEALNRISARGIVTMCEIAGVGHAGIAMNAAVGAFSVRHVFGFGDAVPDGITPLEIAHAFAHDITAARSPDIPVITFDVTADGPRLVPRNHLQIVAGGLAVALESDLPQGATILSTILPCSFAGLSSGTTAWLVNGGALCLHHPLEMQALEAQLRNEACAALIAPAAMAERFASRLAQLPHLRHMIGLWRAPEQARESSPWQHDRAAMTDIYAFGEAGLFGAQRGADGMPAQILPGPYSVPRHRSGATAGEVFMTAHRTLALRGATVAPAAYSEAVDHVDTHYPASIDATSGAIRLSAPPTGVLSAGGYRFLARDLQAWADRLGTGSTLTAQPDPLISHRLSGHAADNSRARAALAELGLNPLISEAFRGR